MVVWQAQPRSPVGRGFFYAGVLGVRDEGLAKPKKRRIAGLSPMWW
jgi:hypothetical protein